MSRTYRKNKRCFWKHKGVCYNSYEDKTVKGKASRYTDFYRYGMGKEKNVVKDFSLEGANWFYEEVVVGDSENYSHTMKCKKMFARIDRARYRQALYRNEDTHIVSAYNPWDW